MSHGIGAGMVEALEREISLRAEDASTDYLYNDIGLLFYVYAPPQNSIKGPIHAANGELLTNA